MKLKLLHISRFKERYFVNSRGKKLYSLAYQKPTADATILFLHEYSLHTGFYKEFFEKLHRNNCNIFGFDFEGFGQSDGMRADIREFDYFIDDIRQFYDLIKQECNGGPIILAGHGMGAVAAIIAQKHFNSKINGLLLMGPLFRYSSYVPKIIQDIARYVSGVAGTFPILSLDFNLLSKDEQVLKKIESDELIYKGKLRARMASNIVNAGEKALQEIHSISIPTLLLNGKKDKLTRTDEIAKIEENGTQKNLEVQWLDNAGHTLMMEQDSNRVIDSIGSWKSRNLLK